MGVWTTVHVYQRVPKPTLLSSVLGRSDFKESLMKFEEVVQNIGIDFFSNGMAGHGNYDGFCEDNVLSEVESDGYESLLSLASQSSKVRWVHASFEHRDERLTNQINAELSKYPEVAGEFGVIGIGVTAGKIIIEDEFNERFIHTNLMIDFWNSYSPNDAEAYAELLLKSDPVQQLLISVSDVADPASWRSALVVT